MLRLAELPGLRALKNCRKVVEAVAHCPKGLPDFNALLRRSGCLPRAARYGGQTNWDLYLTEDRKRGHIIKLRAAFELCRFQSKDAGTKLRVGLEVSKRVGKADPGQIIIAYTRMSWATSLRVLLMFDCRSTLSREVLSGAEGVQHRPRTGALAANALQTVGSRLQEAHTRVVEMSTEQVERRVAHALLRLAKQAGRKVEKGVRIDFPISRQDVAEMTGTTLHTVSRILSAWEAQGWVEGGRQEES